MIAEEEEGNKQSDGEESDQVIAHGKLLVVESYDKHDDNGAANDDPFGKRHDYSRVGATLRRPRSKSS